MPRGRSKPSAILTDSLEIGAGGDRVLDSAAEGLLVETVLVRFLAAWTCGDADALEACLHPDLRKHLVYAGGTLSHREAAHRLQELLGFLGMGPAQPERHVGIRLLDLRGRSASAAVDLGGWFGYIHLRRVPEGWRLVNVLWEWHRG